VSVSVSASDLRDTLCVKSVCACSPKFSPVTNEIQLECLS
jgi:hypothetical protein